ncbi:MAG TPA: GNAT family N-acetyltransferase [Clostridiales bacterium]|nr:GNAT family N-acetyltransferase [Clostridiales bacterium]
MEVNVRRNRITTNRLILRPFEKGDVHAVHEYASDKEVCRFVPWGPNSFKDTEQFIKRTIRARKSADNDYLGDYAVVLKETGQLIGGCGLFLISKQDREYMIGYCLRRDKWGMGFAQELAKALCHVAFKILDAHRVVATCDIQNAPSYNVMEKIGMKREGVFQKRRLIKDEWRDECYYALLKEDWQTMRLE